MPLYSSTLRDCIKKDIPTAEVLQLYGQILDGIEAAHLLAVYHRDIKPENILFDTKTGLVLADFGIAHFQEDALQTAVETGPNEKLANFAYAAPEQRFSGSVVDHRADIYALGLILNEMYTKQVAHGTGFRRIKDTAPGYGYLDSLVDLMIQQQPNKRPQSINQVKEELIKRDSRFFDLLEGGH
jgi:serine/threonine protein kinase